MEKANHSTKRLYITSAEQNDFLCFFSVEPLYKNLHPRVFH